MGQSVSFSGKIITGPLGVTENAFPGAVAQIPVEMATIPAGVSFYAQQAVNSPGSFVEMPGVGASGVVTEALFLYLRSNATVQVRLTQTPDSGPDVVSVEYVSGLFLKQAPAGNPVTLVEVLGAGTVEYFAAGNL